MDSHDELRLLIGELNAAWLRGDAETLATFFHEDVVMVLPGFAERLVGRSELVDSYTDFTAHAVVHAFDTSDLHVDVFGVTAVAAYQFDIDYEMEGQRVGERGREILVFARDAHEVWRVVWRVVAASAE